MAVALTTEPSGARLPRGKTIVPVRPRSRACSGAKITSSASTPSCCCNNFAETARGARKFPSVEIFAQGLAGDGERVGVEQAQPAQMQHDFRHAAGEKHAHGWMMHRAVGQDADQARHTAIDVDPVVDSRQFSRRRGRSRECAATNWLNRRRPRARPSRFGCWRR